ncbi:rhamnan synthesis F family protein [Cellulomonas sp. URHB0016]
MTLDLAQHGYRRVTGSRLWLREGRAEDDFTYNDGDDFESSVAQAVRDSTDLSSRSPELSRHIRDWPTRYHLSSQRANLVRPLLPLMEGPVLEIGAGMGAVTRALGEHGLETVAVEGSVRRATVCADRCRDLDNVQVVGDTIQGFGRPQQFTTVVVVGVLEYSRVFGFEPDGRDPVDIMLDHVAGLLAPGGQLVLAIENQLGLKYLAGFPEDHVGLPMFGIEDRYGDETVVTFGREELTERISRAGLGHQDWYFPFPDYKLPTTVLSERALAPDSGFDATPLVARAGQDHQDVGTTFALSRAWGPVERNGLVADLANSFLVRASASALAEDRPLAWYFGSADRRTEFSKTTTFEPSDDGIVVRRERSDPSLPAVVGNVELVLADERYLPGRPWSGELAAIVGRPGWTLDQLADWFAVWLDELRASLPDVGDLQPDTVLPGHYVDALPRNLMVSGEARRFVDLEWSSTEPVTLRYVVFRALYDSLASLDSIAPPAEGTPTTLEALLTTLSARLDVPLDQTSLDSCWSRERDFQSTVLGRAVDASTSQVLGVRLAPGQDDGALIARARERDAAVAERDTLTADRLAVTGERDDLRRDRDRLLKVEATLREEIDRRGAELTRLGTEAAVLAEDLLERGTEADRLSAELTEAALRLTAEAERAESQEAAAREASQVLTAELSAARNELAAVRRTLSWRVTAPIRASRKLAGRVRRAGRRLTRRRPLSISSVTGGAVADGGLDIQSLYSTFDATYYRATNDDLAEMDDAQLRLHFHTSGRAEGRRWHSVLGTSRTHVRELDPERSTVLLLFHDATRTGAPVLGWNILRELGDRYNVVAVLLRGGELRPDIESVAAATLSLDDTQAWSPREDEVIARHLAETYRPVYAVANSAATYPLVPALERAGVPVVGLVHEFAPSMRPHGVLSAFLGSASDLVFPAELVVDSMRTEYADMLGRGYHIVPQGKSTLPPGDPQSFVPRTTPRGPDGIAADLPERDLRSFLAELDPDATLVIGAGTIAPRKGVEFFIQAAVNAHRTAPGVPVVFAWIGDRIPPLQWYIDDLHEQVRRSDAGGIVTFLAPVADLAPLYERANILFLSSRLDPLPNVTIDAAIAGLPVVAFDGASGYAEWLHRDAGLSDLVVGHLDSAAAAATIVALAEDPERRREYGERLRRAAEVAFDIGRYAARLDELGLAAKRRAVQALDDAAVIEESGRFSAELYAGTGAAGPLPSYVEQYVRRSALVAPRARPRAGLIARRPTEGFNPLVYAERAPGYDPDRDGDPFADYLRKGEPAGPWRRQVIRPRQSPVPAPDPVPRVLVHGHFHYPDLAADLLERLAGNETPVALVLTTTSASKVDRLSRGLERSGLARWDVRLVPNRGRDLAPLFTQLGADELNEYDLVLHVHGKKSPHVESATADRWRTFLWENLVGGQAPMLDEICAAFAADPTLGLVSPEDPHLNDWDLNRSAAESLVARLGLTTTLPNHFDFPMGSMFWARPQALRPALEAKLTWDEYPEEPVPIDGTMLHALERILPFVVEEAGYTYAKTVVPGVTR